MLNRVLMWLIQLQQLVQWLGIEFKAKKCGRRSIARGRVTKKWSNVSQERMAALKEGPVKSLGREYRCPATDRSKQREIQQQVKKCRRRGQEWLARTAKDALPVRFPVESCAAVDS